MDSNEELVDYLVRQKIIRTENVEDAFRKVDRGDFVPADYRDQAYVDKPLPINDEATISAPHIVAKNTELLEVEKDSKIIEIGSGSGYQLAILSELGGKVTGVEIVDNLVESAREKLEDRENVEIIHGSGFKNIGEKFDRIIYSCAVKSFREAGKHLKEDGIAVAPLKKDSVQILQKLEDSKITSHGRVRFVSFKD